MAKKTQDTFEAASNDRTSQMPDVHRLGDVRRRIINHDLLRFDLLNTESFINDDFTSLLLKPVSSQFQVDEPRPGDFDGFAKIVKLHFVDHLLREFSWDLP